MRQREKEQAGKWTPVVILSIGIIVTIAYVSLGDRRLKNILKRN